MTPREAGRLKTPSFGDAGVSRTSRTSRAIYDMLKSQISEGTLVSGQPLPSTRVLASELSVSRTTVSAVYDQLAAEGFLETRQGRRAIVAAGVKHSANPKKMLVSDHQAPRLSAYGQRICASGPVVALRHETLVQPEIDFLYGALAHDDFPTLSWRRAYNSVLVQRQARLSYEPPEGTSRLRTAIQGYLHRARGLVCSADQIVIVNGSQQAIDLCARVLIDTEDRVVIEEPCYAMARRVFESVGASVQGYPVDEDGLLTHELKDVEARLVYVTPSHQFPLGGVLPIGRRQELLAWAKRMDAWILEDDYDGEFRYGQRPIDTLQSIDDSSRVIYIGTFSKTLSPQLRLGYLVLPASLVPSFREAKRLVDRHAAHLDQLALAALIEDGTYERHVRRCKRKNDRRRQALCLALTDHFGQNIDIEGVASGLHIVVWLKGVPKRAEMSIVKRAEQQGLGVRSISYLYFEGDRYRVHDCAGLVLGYASLELENIREGVRRLARVVAAHLSRRAS